MRKRKGFGIAVPKYRPVAVVDIGSNSVRLVVYDGLRRSPSPVFNEKLLCGLGKGVAITGKLGEEGIVRALGALRRFRALTRQIGAKQTFAVATAAAREASNGQAFIDEAEEALSCSIDVLTGKEEARLAALGVISGMPEADGVAGDLGGGSLELIDIKDGHIRDGITLPVGPLRMIDLSARSIPAASRLIDEQLDKARVIERLKGRNFYAVGGTWRNLAKLHMAQSGYPLHVLHNYTITRGQARSVADLVSNLSPASLKDISAISKSRTDTMPYGALVLERLLERAEVENVIFSICGVREGLLFSKLPSRKRKLDPLISSCWDFARRYSRSAEHEVELCDWTDQMFGPDKLPETEGERRLRHCACLLADIGWRAHPDYRAERSLGMISQAAFLGIDHPGRVFLALCIYLRYEGDDENGVPRSLERLTRDGDLPRAHLLSSMFRLAYILSAAMPGLLPRLKLDMTENRTLTLRVPRKLKDLMGEQIEKRLSRLAAEIGRSGRVEIK